MSFQLIVKYSEGRSGLYLALDGVKNIGVDSCRLVWIVVGANIDIITGVW